MFLNISTGGDLRRIVVRVCACLLIVGLVGHTLIIGPIPLAKANVAHLPAPISAPPEPFEVPKGGGILSLLPEASGDIASLFTFAAPKSNESKDSEAGFEKAVLEPFRNSELGTSNPEFSSPPAAGDVEFDFDGDNKADIGRWRGVATEFKVKNSGSGGYSTYTLGSSGAVAAPCVLTATDRRTRVSLTARRGHIRQAHQLRLKRSRSVRRVIFRMRVIMTVTE